MTNVLLLQRSTSSAVQCLVKADSVRIYISNSLEEDSVKKINKAAAQTKFCAALKLQEKQLGQLVSSSPRQQESHATWIIVDRQASSEEIHTISSS